MTHAARVEKPLRMQTEHRGSQRQPQQVLDGAGIVQGQHRQLQLPSTVTPLLEKGRRPVVVHAPAVLGDEVSQLDAVPARRLLQTAGWGQRGRGKLALTVGIAERYWYWHGYGVLNACYTT